jgi:hypothetical protein
MIGLDRGVPVTPRKHARSYRWLAVSLAALAAAALAGCATTSSASAPATASSPQPTGADSGAGTAACVTSQAKANCGPFNYSEVQGTSSGPIVGNDVWNPISGWKQTLYADNPGHWHVTAVMPAGNTAVVSYPSSGSYYGGKLSSFSSMTSSFTENMHATGSTTAWAAYDIWLNDYNNEVMIQHDFANNGLCPMKATATFGGSRGVPVQHWYLCQYGSELIWKLYNGSAQQPANVSEQSGSVDILAMLTWLEDHGYLPHNSTLVLIGYGWELCSTGGVPETFTVSRYSISAS